MTNLTTTSTPDFKVNPTTGEAFISVKKTAELLGVPRTTLRDYLSATLIAIENKVLRLKFSICPPPILP